MQRRIATSPNIVVVADTNVAKVAAARAAADTDATQVLWTISAEVMDAEDTPTKHQKVKVPDEDKIDIKLKKADDDDDDDQSKENEERNWNLFADYSVYSTIHGVRYFGEQQRHWLEKLWWISMFFAAVALSLWLIVSTYINWQENAVVVGFGEEVANVWDIPFPALTICPEMKIHNSTVLNYAAQMQCMEHRNCNNSEETISLLSAAELVCHYQWHESGDLKVPDNVTNIIRELAPKLSDVFELCSFREEIVDCSTIFAETLTNEGVCWTFNMLQNKEILTENIDFDFRPLLNHQNSMENYHPEAGYTISPASNQSAYPQRVLSTAGTFGTLYLELKVNGNSLERTCAGAISGFRVMVHPNDVYPNMIKNFKRVNTISEAEFILEPKITRAESEIAAYSPEQRQCYFKDERKLRFFAVYNQNNCELECLSRFIEKFLGCLTFYMPRNESTPICTLDVMRKAKMLERSFFDGPMSLSERKMCRCYPACNVVSYETTVIATRSTSLITADSLLSTLTVGFEENEFDTMRRFELSGPLDFLAACGGFLGLFMGISMLSIVELLYFVSLRMCCNIFKKVQMR